MKCSVTIFIGVYDFFRKTSYGNGMRILRKMYPRPFFISTEGALERSTIILNPKDSNTALVVSIVYVLVTSICVHWKVPIDWSKL